MTLAQEHFGFSPSGTSSSPDPSEEHSSSLLYDDDFFDDDLKPLPSIGGVGIAPSSGPAKKSTGRKGPSQAAADKRATHNAIERARRESLNGRFMTLAEALPSMANVKRPSKSVIVNRALEYVYDSQVKEHALIKENNELRREVDQLRARLGMAPLPPPAPLLAGKDDMTTTPSPPAPLSVQVPISAPPPVAVPTLYHKSFPSALGAGFADELGPVSTDHMSGSPASSTAATTPPVASPFTSAAPAPTFSTSPAPLTPTSSEPSSVPTSAATHPSLLAAQLLQAQFGYPTLNPTSLSQQQATLFAAMQFQAHQQQAFQQHHQQQQQHGHQFQDVYSSMATGGWYLPQSHQATTANVEVSASPFAFMS